jgi:hypothetical protein
LRGCPVSRKLLQACVAIIALATVMVYHPSAAAAAEVLGPYEIVGEPSGRCVDNPNSSTANVTMVIWTCHTPRSANQTWYFEATDSGYYWIKNQVSGKCLAVYGASTSENVQIIQYACNYGDNEEWKTRFVHRTFPGGRDYYLLENRKSKMCISVAGDSNSNGAKLVQTLCAVYFHVSAAWTWY